MRPYETILSKIAPVFYKLEQYYEYYDNHYTIMQSYLKYMKLPEVYHIHFTAKNIHYDYYISYDEYSPFWSKTESGKIITLTTKDINIQETYFEMTFDEFIVDMIINNFGFKNVYVYNMAAAGGLNNIFIALVGKDMYDTIRKYIK